MWVIGTRSAPEAIASRMVPTVSGVAVGITGVTVMSLRPTDSMSAPRADESRPPAGSSAASVAASPAACTIAVSPGGAAKPSV